MADEADEAQDKSEAEVRRKANPNANRCIDCQEAQEGGSPFQRKR